MIMSINNCLGQILDCSDIGKVRYWKILNVIWCLIRHQDKRIVILKMLFKFRFNTRFRFDVRYRQHIFLRLVSFSAPRANDSYPKVFREMLLIKNLLKRSKIYLDLIFLSEIFVYPDSKSNVYEHFRGSN
jgi:hypothetical protein